MTPQDPIDIEPDDIVSEGPSELTDDLSETPAEDFEESEPLEGTNYPEPETYEGDWNEADAAADPQDLQSPTLKKRSASAALLVGAAVILGGGVLAYQMVGIPHPPSLPRPAEQTAAPANSDQSGLMAIQQQAEDNQAAPEASKPAPPTQKGFMDDPGQLSQPEHSASSSPPNSVPDSSPVQVDASPQSEASVSTSQPDAPANAPHPVAAAPMAKPTSQISPEPSAKTASPASIGEPVSAPEAPAKTEMSNPDATTQAESAKSPSSVASPAAITPVKSPPLAKKKASAAAPVSAPKWELRSARPGEAMIARSGQATLAIVHVGDNVSGLGDVKSISQVEGKWVVQGTIGSLSQ